jgi:predicted negative regulator of RcsB-dependent stress response
MKTLFRIAIFCITAACEIKAQTQTSDSQLNQLWKDKNYSQIKFLLESNRTGTSPDVGLLHCAKFFYVIIEPDKSKALSALTRLKQIADSTGKQTFIDLVQSELAEVQNIPESEFVSRDAAMLNEMHVEFHDTFPNITFAASLRHYLQP